MKPQDLPKKLTDLSISRLPITDGRYDVADHQIQNLYMTVYPSGKKSWVFRYRSDSKSKRFRIGSDAISAAKARAKARKLAGDLANGIDPNAEKQRQRREQAKSREGTLRKFIESRYEPWALVERKSGKATINTITSAFGFLFDKPMESISEWELEKWRRERHKSGISPSSTNRQIAALRACLSKAIEWQVIDKHPLKGLKASRVDRSQTPRIIDKTQEVELRRALRARDRTIRKQRMSANEWRKDRDYDLKSDFGPYVDHLEPMVLIALNTGMRRGEILQLKWSDVHKDKIIVRGKTTKSSQTREIPLNKETTKVFKDWHSDSDWVFPGSGENPLTTVKRSWGNVKKAAKLPDLRFHDLRHTFATRILRRGADIKTVSALLGHANIATTTKYLHATDESKKKAVEML